MWEGDRGDAGGIGSIVPFPPVGREGDRGDAGGILRTLEIPLFGLFLACWVAVVAHGVGAISLAAGLDLSLYQLYSVAAVVGWLSGNVYIHRRRSLPPSFGRRVAALWMIGPQGIPALLRAMAPIEAQAAAPAVPLYSLAVGAIFFCVPLVFGRRPR